VKIRIPFIHNVRRGLATNSSSSHSLVYFREPRSGHEDETESWVDPEFGWNMFKLTTRREKLLYALVTLLQRDGANDLWIGAGADKTLDMDRYKSMFPDLANSIDNARQGYVDHQSISDPKLLIEAALDPHVEIWGGNDNGDDPHEDYADMYGSTGGAVDKSKAPDGIERVEYLG